MSGNIAWPPPSSESAGTTKVKCRWCPVECLPIHESLGRHLLDVHECVSPLSIVRGIRRNEPHHTFTCLWCSGEHADYTHVDIHGIVQHLERHVYCLTSQHRPVQSDHEPSVTTAIKCLSLISTPVSHVHPWHRSGIIIQTTGSTVGPK